MSKGKTIPDILELAKQEFQNERYQSAIIQYESVLNGIMNNYSNIPSNEKYRISSYFFTALTGITAITKQIDSSGKVYQNLSDITTDFYKAAFIDHNLMEDDIPYVDIYNKYKENGITMIDQLKSFKQRPMVLNIIVFIVLLLIALLLLYTNTFN